MKSVEQTFLLLQLSELSGKHAAEHWGSFRFQKKRQHSVYQTEKMNTYRTTQAMLQPFTFTEMGKKKRFLEKRMHGQKRTSSMIPNIKTALCLM